MFKKKKKNNKLKGVAITASVASVAAGLAAVALKDKKNQKKARDFVNNAYKKGSEILGDAKNQFKRMEEKKSKVKKTNKRTAVKSTSTKVKK
ncbi:MAG TPA: hypothetical protein VFD45_02045 [Patescibacteria group bacterium]|nr:hypothetical protein [Patescibacteria group bacterium]